MSSEQQRTMYDSPTSLRDHCLDVICLNLANLFDALHVEFEPVDDVQWTRGKQLRFRDPDTFLINELSVELLGRLGDKELLCDTTLGLFTAQHTRLKQVALRNAQVLTEHGLHVLKEHKIVSLECTHLKHVTVNRLLKCLNEWSRENLITLNVSECTFIDSFRHYMMDALSTLKNLRELDVSYTEFNQHAFTLVTEDVPHLEKLNISGTLINNFDPLLTYAGQLTSLTAIDFQLTKQHALVLRQLGALRHLDVSIANEHIDLAGSTGIATLIEDPHTLPNLVALDISGWRDHVFADVLITYVLHHTKLRYLGVVLNFDECEPHFSECLPRDVVVAGVATEAQIRVTLARHLHRPLYVQKALYHLFQLSGPDQSGRPDLFELVLPAMEAHSGHLRLHMAATACLYNLSRGDLSKQIHPSLLSRGVNLTLDAMEEFPQEYQLQKNALLTLCSDRILQEVNFEMFRCARLVLDSLCTFEEPNMNRMAVAICSILAAKVTTAETSELGARTAYMRKLLTMVRNRVTTEQSDITLKFTLSALWNLTDESGATCRVFLEEGGAALFLNVLKTFSRDSAIVTKVLGLLNNIAEVAALRAHLMLTPLMEQLHVLLRSEHIDASYFAAGIVAHLASDGADGWTVRGYARDTLLNELVDAIAAWKVPDSEMVAYRSFKPFFPLLRLEMSYQVQLWAVWAIHHVCSKNSSRYCLMLREEGGVEVFRQLVEANHTHAHIRKISTQVLELVSETGL